MFDCRSLSSMVKGFGAAYPDSNVLMIKLNTYGEGFEDLKFVFKNGMAFPKESLLLDNVSYYNKINYTWGVNLVNKDGMKDDKGYSYGVIVIIPITIKCVDGKSYFVGNFPYNNEEGCKDFPINYINYIYPEWILGATACNMDNSFKDRVHINPYFAGLKCADYRFIRQDSFDFSDFIEVNDDNYNKISELVNNGSKNAYYIDFVNNYPYIKERIEYNEKKRIKKREDNNEF